MRPGSAPCCRYGSACSASANSDAMIARTIVAASAFAFAFTFAAQAQTQIQHCSSGTWCGPGLGCCKPGMACAPNGGCMKPGYHDCGANRGLCPPHFHCAKDKGGDPDEKCRIGEGAQTRLSTVWTLRPVTTRARV